MGQRFDRLSEQHVEFIVRQKIFFVATATSDSRVNISPKGMDSLRVIDGNRIAWLNVTGSGNETASHVLRAPRMTLMFCAFEGPPLILRAYGTAKVIHQGDTDWHELFPMFEPLPGARQIFDVRIDLIQASCGMAVPYLTYSGDRKLLNDWARQQGPEGIRKYWRVKNQLSIDDLPTSIIERSGPDGGLE